MHSTNTLPPAATCEPASPHGARWPEFHPRTSEGFSQSTSSFGVKLFLPWLKYINLTGFHAASPGYALRIISTRLFFALLLESGYCNAFAALCAHYTALVSLPVVSKRRLSIKEGSTSPPAETRLTVYRRFNIGGQTHLWRKISLNPTIRLGPE